MFVEKLNKKDLNEFLKSNVFKSYAKVEEIKENFLKENDLMLVKNYTVIPDIFKNIECDESNQIFCGLRLLDMEKIDECMLIEYETIKFTFASWVKAYVLDNLPLVLKVNDFKFEIFPYSHDLNSLNKDLLWQQFMYSKFGEEYLTALKMHLENEKAKKLEKVNKEIEEENNKTIKEIIK